jgi:hypothetical protein
MGKKKVSKNQIWDYENKKIYVTRMLNPPSYNARYLDKLKEDNPDYEIIKKY